MTFPRVALVGFAALLAAACANPAKGKPQAEIGAPHAPPSGAAEGAVRYGFSNDGSRIGFVGSKVTGSHEGSFAIFAGTVDLVGGDPARSSVVVDADAASIVIPDNPRLTAHLKSADFFDGATFPKVHFQATEIRRATTGTDAYTVVGNLEMHGVTKAITFPASIRIGPAVEVDAEFSINRKDFGINYAGKADDLIRDEVLLRISVRARRPA